MATILDKLLAFARESLVFAKAETTFATEIKPTTADQILLAGDGSVAQALGFIPDPQRRNTYSPLPDIVGRYEPGQVSFPFLIKPRAAGTAPDCGMLLKALFGRETIVASTSVTYNLLRTIDTRASLTIWVKNGHFVYRCLGTVLTKGTFPIRANNSEEALGRCAIEGTFAEMRWTGTDELAATLSIGASTFTAKDARKFTVGSYVGFKTPAGVVNDNAGAGYQITAINYGTNVCTFTPVLVSPAQAVDDIVYPWLPTGSENGTLVHGRLGTITRGGVSLPLMSGEISLNFPAKMLNEEKNGQNFATRFVNSGIREVQANVNLLFDANASKHFYDVSQGVQGDLVCNWGVTAAQRFKLTAKNQILSSPQISGNEEEVVAMNGKAFASSAYDDELTLVFD